MRTYLKVKGERVEEVEGDIVREQPLSVYVNGDKFLTLLCSPMMLEALVAGYLWMEKVIADVAEITDLQISAVDGRAEVTLSHPVTLPTERILTSGCGGGITFRIDHRLFPRLESSLRVRPTELGARMKDLFGAAVHYQRSRGIHGAALADRERLLLVAEDVGRHNAIDKIKGEALLRGIPTEDRLLLSTGRISSEMLLKAARMGVPVVASRTSPTEMAVALAEQLGVTICGYVRPDALNVYAGDAGRVGQILGELSRLYNPLTDGPIVDLPTRAAIMARLEAGRPDEAGALLDRRYELYAPIDDAEREGPGTPEA